MIKRINKLLITVILSALLIGLVSSICDHIEPLGDAEAINSKLELLREKTTGSRYYIGKIKEVGR